MPAILQALFTSGPRSIRVGNATKESFVKMTLFALALAAAAPFAASASEANGIGYTYVQLDAVYEDYSNPYMFGGALSGSYAFTDHFFMTGSYGRTTDDGHNWDLRHSWWSLGAGYNTAIGDRVDWVTQASYVRDRYRASYNDDLVSASESESYNGYTISTGAQIRVTDHLITNAHLGWEDHSEDLYVGNDDGNFYGEFGMLYRFNDTWGLHGSLKLSEGTETYMGGIRASF
ncbi:hypothetical protein GCM10025759_11030 [Lysobacter panacisoli]|uniref:Outer membrane protein beta-barrel domain-containing protein n=2 Tax=Lysobacter panacisoli TaxID=1255263 RepID=A0ABP9L9A2_9GAMM